MKTKLCLCQILTTIVILSTCSIISEVSQQQVVKGPEFTAYDGLKTSICILDFKNDTDYGGAKFGSAVGDMLVSLLVRSGRFVILERQRLQQILEEQALGQSGAVLVETAAEAGKFLGVQTIIIGDILEIEEKTGAHDFKKEKDKKNKDEWAFALKTTIGHVKFHYRLVNTSTGEVIYANNSSATEIRPGFGIKTKKFDFEDMYEQDQTVLGMAIRKAVNKMALDIVQHATDLPWTGKVVMVKDNRIVYITPGKNSGVRIGDVFTIFGTADSHPSDNEYIELKEIEKGVVKVVDFIGERVTTTEIIQGGSFQRGDIVRKAKSLLK